jgi:hypothetical protein
MGRRKISTMNESISAAVVTMNQEHRNPSLVFWESFRATSSLCFQDGELFDMATIDPVLEPIRKPPDPLVTTSMSIECPPSTWRGVTRFYELLVPNLRPCLGVPGISSYLQHMPCTCRLNSDLLHILHAFLHNEAFYA